MNPLASKNMLLNSDSPLDKVIYIATSQITVPAGQFSQLDIPHGLPFTPLLFGNWSTSPDFSITYEYGTGPIHSNLQQAIFTAQPNLRSSSSVANLTVTNYNTSSTLTAYCRVYGFQPSGTSSVALAHTNTGVDPFMINTDQQQVQLIHEGLRDFPSVSYPNIVQITLFSHNLGYRPQVMSWVSRDGWTQNLYMSAMAEDTVSIVVTDSDVILRVEGQAIAGTVHIRVYANE